MKLDCVRRTGFKRLAGTKCPFGRAFINPEALGNNERFDCETRYWELPVRAKARPGRIGSPVSAQTA